VSPNATGKACCELRVRAKVSCDRVFASKPGQTVFHWLAEKNVNRAQQPGQVERLFHQCGDSRGSGPQVLIRLRRYDDNLQQRVNRRKPIESLPATFYWHVEIEQSDIEAAFSHPLYGFATVLRNDNIVVFGSERRAQSGEYFCIIISQEHICFHHCYFGCNRLDAGAVPGKKSECACYSARKTYRNQ
jgi:hypothetical protein